MKNLTKKQYEQLQKDHEEGCKINDYSKMIMGGDEKDQAMKKYLRDNKLCKHDIREEGRIDVCRICGERLG